MRVVIFDLDGTLVDSAAALCAIANQLMDELGCARLDLAEARANIGHGARWFLEKTLKARGGAYDPATFEARFARYQELYAAAPGSANPAYPGVAAVLESLSAEAGVRLALCTNKPRAPTNVVLEAHGWAGIFDAVVAGDDLAECKPHPLPLLTARDRSGAERAIYVGDSEVDAATAEAAGIPFLLFTEGYRKGPVDEMFHTATFAHHDELLALIASL